MDNLLANVFELVELKTAVYFVHDFVSPWGLRIPRRPHAQFHLVLEGAAQLVAGSTHVQLTAGHLGLLLRGMAHTISDGMGVLREGPQIVPAIVRGEQPFGPGNPSARILSGHFELKPVPFELFFAGLPDVLHVRDAGRTADPHLLAILAGEMNRQQPSAPEPCTDFITRRLAEIALVQVLRVALTAEHKLPSVLAGIFDPRLNAAFQRIHTGFAEPLSLAELASAASLSRSAFAQHFRQATGTTPVTYLTRLRMLHAERLLRTSQMSIGEVAEAVGHQSQEGFSRAYKRTFGHSPRHHRMTGMKSIRKAG